MSGYARRNGHEAFAETFALAYATPGTLWSEKWEAELEATGLGPGINWERP